jgi:DNA-binding IscR family transcriptional regulator
MREESLQTHVLLAVSPDMVLATNVVLFLAGRKGHVATVRELSRALGMSRIQATDVLTGLARQRVVEWHGNAETAYLAVRRDALTLADIARATGEWLLVAECDDDADGACPGLRMAMAIVRERCLGRLEQMPVLALVTAVS